MKKKTTKDAINLAFEMAENDLKTLMRVCKKRKTKTEKYRRMLEKVFKIIRDNISEGYYYGNVSEVCLNPYELLEIEEKFKALKERR